MKIFSRLNKMAFLACAGLVIGGCGFFGDLFGVVNVDSTQGKFGEGQSVCNNAKKEDIFISHYGIMFNKIGNLSGGLSAEQVEKILNAQISYIDIKRNEKDNICGYVMTMDNTYSKVTLTSQEIGQLERALADNNQYRYYESSKEVKRDYYTALKFLKYIKRWNIPNDKNGLEALDSLGQTLSYLNSAEPVAIHNFLFGKKQRINGYGFTDNFREEMDLVQLRGFLNSYTTQNNPCAPSISKATCSSHLNEVRAIKNYAESVFNK